MVIGRVNLLPPTVMIEQLMAPCPWPVDGNRRTGVWEVLITFLIVKMEL